MTDEFKFEDSYFLKTPGPQLRLGVLIRAIEVEDRITHLLRSLLCVMDGKKLPLQFDAKIRFLEAIGTISDEQKRYLDAFKVIRNRFIHELETDTFEKCFARDGLEKQVMHEIIATIKDHKGKRITEGSYVVAFFILAVQINKTIEYVEAQVKERADEVSNDKFFTRVHHNLAHTLTDPVDRCLSVVLQSGQESFSLDEVARLMGHVKSDLSALLEVAYRKSLDHGKVSP